MVEFEVGGHLHRWPIDQHRGVMMGSFEKRLGDLARYLAPGWVLVHVRYDDAFALLAEDRVEPFREATGLAWSLVVS